MLRRGLNIAQPPLQRRGLIEHAAAAEGEAGTDGPHADGCDPRGSLRALDEERIVFQRSRKRMAPVACGLDLEQPARRPDVRRGTTELTLAKLRPPHRRRRPL